jgi:hypothetical protein
MAIYTQISTVFEETARRLTAANLPTHCYMIPDCPHYGSITGRPHTDVYCLECQLGPAHHKPGFTAYAVAQVFDPAFPNLALIFMVERDDLTGAPHSTIPTYNPQIDHAFSYTFLPIIHTAFNVLDQTGKQNGLLVQSYNARITLSDLPQAGKATVSLMRRFKQDGQLAQIAVDFDDPLTMFVAQLVKPLTINADVHYLPRTKTPSDIQFPLKNRSGGYFLIGNNSTALDEGFSIAYGYLADHSLVYCAPMLLDRQVSK